jgi:hypothetical protein
MRAAYTDQHRHMFRACGPALEWDASCAQGPEAFSVSQKFKEAIKLAEPPSCVQVLPQTLAGQVQLNNAANEIKKALIEKALAESVGYASLPYIARKANLDTDEAARILDSDPTFRKSAIRTRGGENVYMLNSQHGWLYDTWKAFCYLNWLKYR